MVEGLEEFIQNRNIKTRDGKLVLYKAVSKEWRSLYIRMITGGDSRAHGAVGAYRPGTVVKASVWSTNSNNDCGEGLHVCTLRRALKYRDLTYFDNNDWKRRLVEVLVNPKDVVYVPRYNSSKIRCKRLFVVAEVNSYGRPC